MRGMDGLKLENLAITVEIARRYVCMYLQNGGTRGVSFFPCCQDAPQHISHCLGVDLQCSMYVYIYIARICMMRALKGYSSTYSSSSRPPMKLP